MRTNLDRRSTVRSLAVASVLIAATILTPAVAGLGASATITVCKDASCDYTEIQSAVDAAQPGDEVVVHDADEDYQGPVRIDTPRVTLTAREVWGDPVEVHAGGDSVLQVRANDVTVEGFHFVGARAEIEQARDVTLDFLILNLADDGLAIRQSTATVTTSLIWSDGTTPSGTAVTVDGTAAGAVIQDTTITMFGDAIEIVDADDVRIEHNSIAAAAGQAVHLVGASDGVTGTRVLDNSLAAPGGTLLQIDQDGAEVRDTVVRSNDIQSHQRAFVVASDGDTDWTDDPVDARWNWWGLDGPSTRSRGSVLVAPWCLQSSCPTAPPAS